MLKNVLRVIAFCLLGALAPKVEAQVSPFFGVHQVERELENGDVELWGQIWSIPDGKNPGKFDLYYVVEYRDEEGKLVEILTAKGSGQVGPNGKMEMSWPDESDWNGGTWEVDPLTDFGSLVDSNGKKYQTFQSRPNKSQR